MRRGRRGERRGTGTCEPPYFDRGETVTLPIRRDDYHSEVSNWCLPLTPKYAQYEAGYIIRRRKSSLMVPDGICPQENLMVGQQGFVWRKRCVALTRNEKGKEVLEI